MVPCLHQCNVYIKRNLQVWKVQKCILLVGANTALTCAGLQTTPSHVTRYRAENGNLRKFGSTFPHGTVFATMQCLYQKEATGMESPKMYFSSRCKSRTYLCVPVNYPISCEAVLARERKFRSTFLHGTVFAPKKCCDQKEAMGMESPKMYSSSLCKNHTYLCGPANYPI